MIGLKYCGGCNCKYDRVKATSIIKSSISEAEFIYPDENNIVDVLIVIAGCHVNCAAHKHLNVKYDRYFITDETEVSPVIHKIREKFLKIEKSRICCKNTVKKKKERTCCFKKEGISFG